MERTRNNLLQMLARFKYFQKVLHTEAANLLAYWPLWESSGTVINDISGNARNGTYVAPTLAQPGIGDGKTSVALDGSTSRGNMYSASLAGAFNGLEYSIACWAAVSDAGIWTENANRYIFWFAVDAATGTGVLKLGTAGSYLLQGISAAGGVTKFPVSGATTTLNFFHVALTYSLSNDRFRFYLNGSKQGVDQTGLAAWVGSLNSARCALGSVLGTSTSSPWKGRAAHLAMWSKELTPAEVVSIASPFDGGYITVLPVGDSKSAQTTAIWVTTLNELYIAVGQHCIERPYRIGVGGIRVAGMQARVDADIAAMVDTPENVLINLGVNDCGTVDFDAAQCKTDMDYIVDAYHVAFPSARIFLSRVWKSQAGQAQTDLTTLNGKFDELIVAHSWLSVGVNEPAILPAGDNGATMLSDGLHYSAAGHAAIAAAWMTILG